MASPQDGKREELEEVDLSSLLDLQDARRKVKASDRVA